ncbi:MAG: hypothetical protein MI922_16130, partial [Bacteroidales bacterium]|nr:hypothetical protein [Bacteroidales bacterium]
KYFCEFPVVKQKKISPNLFQKYDNININFLQYLSGETSEDSKRELTGINISSIKSKALLTGFFVRYGEKESLKQMNTNLRGEILVGLKSLIECFEDVIDW